MHFWALVLCLFFSFFISQGQDDYFRFKYLTIDNGLGSGYVESFLKDKKGFLWIGTNKSLDRFDGYRVKNYFLNNKDSTALWGSIVSSVKEDKEGNLWIAAGRGINKLDFKSNKVYHFLQDDTINFRNLRKLLFENDSLLWIGSDSGLALFNIRTCKVYQIFKHNPADVNSVKPNGVVGIIKDSKGDTWISSWNNGISRYNRTQNNFTHFIHNHADSTSIFSIPVFCMVPDENGIWVLGDKIGYLARLELSTLKFHHFKRSDFNFTDARIGFYDGSVDIEGNVWLATRHEGIVKFDKKTQKFVNLQREIGTYGTLSENLVRSILCDDQGILWLGTFNNGVNYVNTVENKAKYYSFANFKKPEPFKANFYCKDRYQQLWIATTKGILSFDTVLSKFVPVPLNLKNHFENFSKAIPLPTDEILFCSKSENIAVDVKTRNYRSVPKEEANKWKDCYNGFDSKGNYYVRDNKSLIFFRNGSTKPDTILVNKLLKSFQIVTENALDMPIADNGMYTFFPVGNDIYRREISSGKLEIFLKNVWEKPPGKYDIHAAFMDGDTLRLINTINLTSINIKDKRYNTKRLKFLKETEVIPVALPYGKDKICISTFRGIFVFDIGKNLVFRPDIFSDVNRNPDFLCKVSASKFITEVANGLALFDPSIFKLSRKTAPISVTDFYLFNSEIKIAANSPLKSEIIAADKIELTYRDYNFSFEFSLLTFENHENIEYAYMLEGFDKRWNYIGSRKVAGYTNIPPGSYIFRYMGKGANHDWSEGKPITVVIKPEFWQTWWFYLLLTILLIMLVMAIIKIRVRVIKLQKERLERMVKQRTLEIVEKNNEIMAQNEEIEAQNEKLAELFDELTQNIETAKRLQQSALPLSETIANFIPEHFILYRPKDIVSGDFYWFHEKFGKLYLAAIDCTGHGVSGAFMSLIGKSLLDKIIVENPTYQAGEILNELSASLVRALNQDREESFSKEGMDIALCIIDKEEEMIQFAGANNPLFIKNGNELEVIKGDAFGIGLLKGKAASGFTSHNISIKPNDIFYIFSDGYFSQFGGGSGEEKLKIARFKEVIMGLGNIPLQHHKEELEQYLEKWQRSTGQTDDILVIGFKG